MRRAHALLRVRMPKACIARGRSRDGPIKSAHGWMAGTGPAKTTSGRRGDPLPIFGGSNGNFVPTHRLRRSASPQAGEEPGEGGAAFVKTTRRRYVCRSRELSEDT